MHRRELERLAGFVVMVLCCQLARAGDWKDITSWLCPGQSEIPKAVTTTIDYGKDLPDGRLIQGTNYEYMVVAVGNNYSQESNTATNTPRKVVVLVRGYGDPNPNYWAAMSNHLAGDHFEVWDATSALDGRNSVYWNVSQLQGFINAQVVAQIEQGRPAPQRLSILAHSMGGVITREYLARGPQIPVDCVVMLSPANCGSWLANQSLDLWWLPGLPNPGWVSTYDMCVQNALLFNRTHHILPGRSTGRRYYTAAGTDADSLFGGTPGSVIRTWVRGNHPDLSQVQPYELANDGVITMQSSWGQVSRADAHFTFPTLPEAEVIRDFGVVGFDETRTAGLNHFAIISSRALYDSWIKPKLLALSGMPAPPLGGIAKQKKDGGEGETSAVQWAAAFSGVIRNLELTNFPVVVDTSAQAQFALLWSTGTLAFALIRPDGVRITPASTNTHPEVSYRQDAAAAVYTVLNPTTGVWRVEIAGSDVGAAGTDYGGLVLLWNELGLAIERGEAFHPTHGTLQITGRLAEGPTPILNATVGGLVVRPDGTTNELVLLDDGLHGDGAANDGLYGAVFTNTAQKGVYALRLQASGLKPGGEAFQRVGVGQTTFNAFEPTAAFTDSYDDYGIDLAPTNGLIDYFVIEVGVRAVATGDFTVAGTLTATNGVEIATVLANLVVTNIGTQTVLLKFDATAIHDSKARGGFDLRNLVLCGTGANFAPLDSRSFAYATAGYDWNQFQFSDKDADGLSDTEERDVYHTNPELADSDADALSDHEELFLYHTNPLSPDTDGDQMPDGWEVAHRLNPLLGDANLDFDNDGLTDSQETDSVVGCLATSWNP
ncbi:MAG: choice-of-anchor X domain-containing protein, partial [Verrucomicrobiota bacterium]